MRRLWGWLPIALVACVTVLAALAGPQTAALAANSGDDGKISAYRLFNEWTGEHLLTTDRHEYDSLRALGWRGEGERFQTFADDGVTVYRLYNPWNSDHHYTKDYTEYESLQRNGWSGEGACFYGADPQDGFPVYRLYNPYQTENGGLGSHLWTTDANEYQTLAERGWNKEGVSFYSVDPDALVAPDIPAEPGDYTRGEWVKRVVDLLEFEVPADDSGIIRYYADSADDPNGLVIEVAERNGILPPADVEDLEQDVPLFNGSEPATREFAAYVMVHALGFDGTNSEDVSNWADYDSIAYKNEAAVAVANRFLSLDGSRRFNPTRQLSSDDATSLVSSILLTLEQDVAGDGESKDDSLLAEGAAKVEDPASFSIVDNGDGTYTVTAPGTGTGLVRGEVSIFDETPDFPGGIALKVVSIRTSGGKTVAECVKPDIGEVYERLDFAVSGVATVGEVEPAEGMTATYDPDDEASVAGQVSPLFHVGGGVGVPGTFTFKTPEKGLDLGDGMKAKGSFKVKIPDIRCEADADFWPSFNLNMFELSVTEDVTLEGKIELASGHTSSNPRPDLGDILKTDRVELGRIPVELCPGISFDIIAFYKAEANMTAQVTYELHAKQGYEFRNGCGRPICETNGDFTNLKLDGSAKFGLGVAGDICALSYPLVGYSAELGPALEGSVVAHVNTERPMMCLDVASYIYMKHGIDTDALVGKFLKEVCHYTLEFEPLKNDKSNPFRANLHFENGRLVDECTYGMGALEGYVYDLADRAPLAHARVRIYTKGPDSVLVKSLYTKDDGSYRIDKLADGYYKLTISATGYKTYHDYVGIPAKETLYQEAMLMVGRNVYGDSALDCTITDGVTGQPVTGAEFVVREGWNDTEGDVVDSGTFETSDYTIGLNPGNYTLEVSKPGYTTTSLNVAVSPLGRGTANVVLSPVGTGVIGSDLRVILTWGSTPSDLDSHLVCQSDFDPYHIWYSGKYHDSGEGNVANLDLDDTTSYGPETVTVNSFRPNDKIMYYVHNYSDRGSSTSTRLSTSEAKVVVYSGGSFVASYSVPMNQEGVYWHVFDYDPATGRITPVNQITGDAPTNTLDTSNKAMMLQLDQFPEKEIVEEERLAA